MRKAFQVVIPKSVLKSLKKIPLPWRERIMLTIDLLGENSLMGEKMWGKLKDKRKIRIHPYRIIYIIDKKKRKIIILETGHRGRMSYK